MPDKSKWDQWQADIQAALPFLVEVDMPSTGHMSKEERWDGIEQMLKDLLMLATNDGCIGAAWAFEFCTRIHTRIVAEHVQES